jgi:hypothetical protein
MLDLEYTFAHPVGVSATSDSAIVAGHRSDYSALRER